MDTRLLSQLEDMLSAAIESGRHESHFHRAVGLLEAILHMATDRRCALAFRYWSARVSEGAVNAELIYERVVLIDSFTRAKRKAERATARTIEAARALAVRACACRGRIAAQRALETWSRAALLSSIDSFARDSARQMSDTRTTWLALALSSFVSRAIAHAQLGALAEWAVAVQLLRRKQEQQLHMYTARESVIAEMRLAALALVSCAAELQRGPLSNSLAHWRRVARDLAVGASGAPRDDLANRRAAALGACLAARAAAQQLALQQSVSAWRLAVRAHSHRESLRGAKASADGAAQQHLRVALAARARSKQLESELRTALAAAGVPASAPSPAAWSCESPRSASLSTATPFSAQSPPDAQMARAAASACESGSGAGMSPSHQTVSVELCVSLLAGTGGDTDWAAGGGSGRAAGTAADLKVEEARRRLAKAMRERDALQQLLAAPRGSASASPRSPSIGGSEALGAALRMSSLECDRDSDH
jgi:hypothetical protein